MATTRYGDYFPGTEYYVDYNLGTDDLTAGRGDGVGTDAWKTIKYALETGIPNTGRDTSNGDRLNLNDGTDHTFATVASLASYGATATEAAPLLFQGYTSAANDGGVATIALASSTQFVNDINFDYAALQDIRMTGNISSGLLVLDRYTSMINCSYINSSTNAPCLVADVYSTSHNCYFEAEDTTPVLNFSMMLDCCMIVQRGSGGGVSKNKTVQSSNTLVVIEGDMGPGEVGLAGPCFHCAVVCLGTPNSSSVGVRGTDRSQMSGNYVENVGQAFLATTTYASQSVVGNSYYNVVTPMVITGMPLYVEDPVDAVTSIFVDATQSTAAACDFTIEKKPGSVDTNNLKRTVGYVDGSNDKTFDIHINATGLGRQGIKFPAVMEQ